eukprot:Rhum_TRINITY_DN14828_c2_g1::Rhum_TRINITY_DN14828_c2_g1_i1::g.123789::m.123789
MERRGGGAGMGWCWRCCIPAPREAILCCCLSSAPHLQLRRRDSAVDLAGVLVPLLGTHAEAPASRRLLLNNHLRAERVFAVGLRLHLGRAEHCAARRQNLVADSRQVLRRGHGVHCLQEERVRCTTHLVDVRVRAAEPRVSGGRDVRLVVDLGVVLHLVVQRRNRLVVLLQRQLQDAACLRLQQRPQTRAHVRLRLALTHLEVDRRRLLLPVRQQAQRLLFAARLRRLRRRRGRRVRRKQRGGLVDKLRGDLQRLRHLLAGLAARLHLRDRADEGRQRAVALHLGCTWARLQHRVLLRGGGLVLQRDAQAVRDAQVALCQLGQAGDALDVQLHKLGAHQAGAVGGQPLRVEVNGRVLAVLALQLVDRVHDQRLRHLDVAAVQLDALGLRERAREGRKRLRRLVHRLHDALVADVHNGAVLELDGALVLAAALVDDACPDVRVRVDAQVLVLHLHAQRQRHVLLVPVVCAPDLPAQRLHGDAARDDVGAAAEHSLLLQHGAEAVVGLDVAVKDLDVDPLRHVVHDEVELLLPLGVERRDHLRLLRLRTDADVRVRVALLLGDVRNRHVARDEVARTHDGQPQHAGRVLLRRLLRRVAHVAVEGVRQHHARGDGVVDARHGEAAHGGDLAVARDVQLEVYVGRVGEVGLDGADDGELAGELVELDGECAGELDVLDLDRRDDARDGDLHVHVDVGVEGNVVEEEVQTLLAVLHAFDRLDRRERRLVRTKVGPLDVDVQPGPRLPRQGRRRSGDAVLDFGHDLRLKVAAHGRPHAVDDHVHPLQRLGDARAVALAAQLAHEDVVVAPRERPGLQAVHERLLLLARELAAGVRLHDVLVLARLARVAHGFVALRPRVPRVRHTCVAEARHHDVSVQLDARARSRQVQDKRTHHVGLVAGLVVDNLHFGGAHHLAGRVEELQLHLLAAACNVTVHDVKEVRVIVLVALVESSLRLLRPLDEDFVHLVDTLRGQRLDVVHRVRDVDVAVEDLRRRHHHGQRQAQGVRNVRNRQVVLRHRHNLLEDSKRRHSLLEREGLARCLYNLLLRVACGVRRRADAERAREGGRDALDVLQRDGHERLAVGALRVVHREPLCLDGDGRHLARLALHRLVVAHQRDVDGARLVVLVHAAQDEPVDGQPDHTTDVVVSLALVLIEDVDAHPLVGVVHHEVVAVRLLPLRLQRLLDRLCAPALGTDGNGDVRVAGGVEALVRSLQVLRLHNRDARNALRRRRREVVCVGVLSERNVDEVRHDALLGQSSLDRLLHNLLRLAHRKALRRDEHELHRRGVHEGRLHAADEGRFVLERAEPEVHHADALQALHRRLLLAHLEADVDASLVRDSQPDLDALLRRAVDTVDVLRGDGAEARAVVAHVDLLDRHVRRHRLERRLADVAQLLR